MSCRFNLQGIFLTQGSKSNLPHCWQTLYHLSHHCYKSHQILLGLEAHGFERHQPIVSPFAFQSLKALLFCFTQNSVSKIKFGTDVQRLSFWHPKPNPLPLSLPRAALLKSGEDISKPHLWNSSVPASISGDWWRSQPLGTSRPRRTDCKCILHYSPLTMEESWRWPWGCAWWRRCYINGDIQWEQKGTSASIS